MKLHSSIDEFLDQNRKYICLLDDNILGCSEWKDILLSLQKSNKRFEFKQGMDIRLMTDEKAKILNDSKYIGSYIFAFDNIKDKDIVEKKLKLWRKYCSKKTKLYIFCGYDRNNKWDYYFWVQDIIDTFERIKVLMKYRCLPYLMRFERYKEIPFYGIYVILSRWCNQPSFYTKQSLRQYVYITDAKCQKAENYSSKRYLEEFEKLHPEIAKEYFDMRFEDLNLYK